MASARSDIKPPGHYVKSGGEPKHSRGHGLTADEPGVSPVSGTVDANLRVAFRMDRRQWRYQFGTKKRKIYTAYRSMDEFPGPSDRIKQAYENSKIDRQRKAAAAAARVHTTINARRVVAA